MTRARYSVAKLAPDMDLSTFDCGEASYNLWLVEHAS